MKYFFVSDTKGGTHLVVAASEEEAGKVAEEGKVIVDDLYELLPDTFDRQGFLISQK